MAVVSKPEVAHSIFPINFSGDICLESTVLAFIRVFKSTFLICAGLNALHIMLRLKKQMPWNVLTNVWLKRSVGATLWPAFAVFFKMASLDLIQNKTDKMSPYSLSFLVDFIPIFLSGLTLDSRRLFILMKYMAFVNLDVILLILKVKRFLPEGVHYQIQVFCFCISMAIFCYYNTFHQAPREISTLLRFLFRIKTEDVHFQPRQIVFDDSSNQFLCYLLRLLRLPDQPILYEIYANRMLNKGPKHRFCKHKYSCTSNIAVNFVRSFGIGYGLNMAYSLLEKFAKIFETRSLSVRDIVMNPRNLEMGYFLGYLTVLYNCVSCILRRFHLRNRANNALVSGFVSGLAIQMFSSPTVSLYCLVESLPILFIDRSLRRHKYISFGWMNFFTAVLCHFALHIRKVKPQYQNLSFQQFLKLIPEYF